MSPEPVAAALGAPRWVERPGLRIAWYELGEGAPTLLLMGLGDRSSDWGGEFLQALATAGRRLILVDNRGTGRSSRPEEAFPLEVLAEDAGAVLDAAGVDRADVLGLSMGGMIAQLLALDHAARVRRLALLSTHAGGPVVPRSPEVLAVFQPAPGTPPDEVVRTAMERIMGPGFASANPAAVEALARNAALQPTSKRAFAYQMQAIFGSNRRARLPGLLVPTLVLHGRLDPLIPVEEGAELARLIPGAELVLLEGVGHMPTWEAPGAVAERLLGFFGGCPAQ